MAVQRIRIYLDLFIFMIIASITTATTPTYHDCANLNPCKDTDQQFYAHTNPSNFVQCWAGNCNVLFCPQGTIWNSEAGLCAETIMEELSGPPISEESSGDEEKKEPESSGQTDVGNENKKSENIIKTYDCEVNNPCNSRVVTDKYNYRNHDPANYVICGENGSCSVEKCAQPLFWNEEIRACFPKVELPETYDCEVYNPCDPPIVTGKYYYQNHDPTNYVQCGAGGTCYVITCPIGLLWNDRFLTCVNA